MADINSKREELKKLLANAPPGGLEALLKMIQASPKISSEVLDHVNPVTSSPGVITFAEAGTGIKWVSPTFRVYNLRFLTGGFEDEGPTELYPMDSTGTEIQSPKHSSFDLDKTMDVLDKTLKRWWINYGPDSSPLGPLWYESKVNPGHELVEVFDWKNKGPYMFCIFDLEVYLDSIRFDDKDKRWKPILHVARANIRGKLF